MPVAYLDKLNPEQRRAVEHGLPGDARTPVGPLLVIAGAGSGKTNTLAHRVAHLIVNHVDPRRILLMTFSRRAAAEMTRRAGRICAQALGSSADVMTDALTWAGTFHAIAARLLREYAEQIGIDPAFTIHDREDLADLMNFIRHELGFSKMESRFPTKATCVAIYSRAVNAEMPLDDVLRGSFPWCAEWERQLRELFAAYVEAKQAQNVLDYDDLLLYWAQTASDPVLAADMSGRFDHVLVDEYQDTNRLQSSILLALKPDGAGLTVVGDDAHRGPDAAEEAGETLLSGVARTLWRRALGREAPGAIERALAELRMPDSVDPACSIIWAPAAELAASPRPHARLLGLNPQAWPRNAMEDPLLPAHLVPPSLLDVLPLAEADRRDFRTIGATTAKGLVLSFGRRDATGRLLGRSPLLADGPVTYLRRARCPDHAMSEADRLMARPGEFAASARAKAAIGCWRDWLDDAITPHDGMISPDHPVVVRVLARTHSATSLQILLRNPLGFVWKYAFGLKTPLAEEEPFRLDALTFGTLTHEILDAALKSLEISSGLGDAPRNAIAAAVAQATGQVGLGWQAATAIPPPLLWRATLSQAAELATAALSYPLMKIEGQQSWSEVHFNSPDMETSRHAPWDPVRAIEIFGTGIVIGGKIDRLDLSADGHVARVIDYKTGAVPRDIAGRVLAGGRELQRCLYAFAVQSLLGEDIAVEAALLYPRGEDAYHPLPNPKTTLDDLKTALQFAVASLRAGRALPGPDTGGDYDDLAFALPAREGARLDRKLVQARALLGEAATIWEAP